MDLRAGMFFAFFISGSIPKGGYMKKLIGVAILLSMTVACAQKAKKSDSAKADMAASQTADDIKSKNLEGKNLAENSYKCVVNKDTRIIQMDKGTNRCEVHYTKFGEKAQCGGL